jgi:phenylacetate-CoA ligase
VTSNAKARQANNAALSGARRLTGAAARRPRRIVPRWDRLSRDEVLARQFVEVQRHVERVYETNEYFRSRWHKAGFRPRQLRTRRDLQRIPMVTKGDCVADQEVDPPFGRRLGVERDSVVEVHLTSGTSGAGQVAFGFTDADRRVAGESLSTWWSYAGLRRGDVAVLTFPVSFLAAGLLGVSGARDFGLAPIYAFGADKGRILELMQRLGAAMIFATPAVLRAFEDTARREGIDPSRDLPSLRALCLGLMTPPFSQVPEFENFWGAKAFEDYGSTEAGLAAAFSCSRGLRDGDAQAPLHFFEPAILCEVIDPDTGRHVSDGEEGELVITTFRREASTSVRFRTGDRVVHASHRSCRCGLPYDGIQSMETRRYDDMVKVKGTNIWPSAVDGVVFAHAEIEDYRALATVDDQQREQLVLEVALRRQGQNRVGRADRLLESLADEVKRATLVRPEVVVVESLPPFDFKATRWRDERPERLAALSTRRRAAGQGSR